MQALQPSPPTAEQPTINMSAPAVTKTVLFLGATGGTGLSALRRSIAVGHNCVALCRTPSRLREKLSIEESANVPNLRIEQGNAHDVDAVARALVTPANRLVDMVVTSIGGSFDAKTFSLDDVHVCEKGAEVLISALAKCRAEGTNTARGQQRPRIVAISSTGLSDCGRDIPLVIVPFYHILLAVPHKDKKLMEKVLIESGEDFTIVRPSWFTDGPGDRKEIRFGVEDPINKTLESKSIGYSICREDVGKWIFENLVQETNGIWVKKIASITH
jgi:nucleoside-diphosphate-sugar epimerase